MMLLLDIMMRCRGWRPLRFMDNILVWNVRGLNRCSKQLSVRNFISAHNISLFGVLETKVKMSKWVLFTNTYVLVGVLQPTVV